MTRGFSIFSTGLAAAFLWLAYPASAQVRDGWTARYRAPDGIGDVPYGLALVADGAVVIGLSQYPDALNELVVLKYSSDGRFLWKVLYRSGPANFTYAAQVVADRTGGVYVALMAATNRWIDGSQTLVMLNVDPAGHLSPLARIGPSSATRPTALKLDRSGNVLVHGTLGTVTGTVYSTLKFAPTGQLLWSREYAGPARQDYASQMTLDAADNIYVTGRSPGTNAINDVATIKYAPDGTPLWVRRYASPDPLASDVGRDLALDQDQNLLVAGGGTAGFLTLRYTSDGQPSWTGSVTNELGDGPANFIAVDAQGNSLTAGSTTTYTYGTDWRLIKRAPDGSLLWTRDYHRHAHYQDTVGGLAVEPSGTSYLTGSCVTNDFGIAVLSTARYSPQGEEIWRIEHPNPVRPFGVGHAIALDPNGDVYVVATARVTSPRDEILVAKYIQARAAAEFLSTSVDDQGRLTTTLFAEAGYEYAVESSPDLHNWSIVTRLFNATGQLTFRESIPPGTTRRFYRAVRSSRDERSR